MSSGGSAESYRRDFAHYEKGLDDVRTREARTARVTELRDTVETRPQPQKRDTESLVDRRHVKNNITHPAKGTERVFVLLIDNSGSNRAIAHKLKASSGYLVEFLRILDPKSEIAIIYFSDHCDEPDGLMQEIDFVHPDENGDKVILSTTAEVSDANGGDDAEAIECVLHRACEIDFAEAKEKHLILVTDVVAHGMGMDSDNGCTHQRNWKTSVIEVNETFTTFTVVGTSGNRSAGELQRQFLKIERVNHDLIDLSSIRLEMYRLGMVANAVLFLIARQLGRQAVELFLAALYEKWLKEPVFGADTDKLAKQMIKRLASYLEFQQGTIEEIMAKVFVD